MRERSIYIHNLFMIRRSVLGGAWGSSQYADEAQRILNEFESITMKTGVLQTGLLDIAIELGYAIGLSNKSTNFSLLRGIVEKINAESA